MSGAIGAMATTMPSDTFDVLWESIHEMPTLDLGIGDFDPSLLRRNDPYRLATPRLPTVEMANGRPPAQGPGAAEAEYVVVDTTDFFRASEFRFGHRGRVYFVEQRQGDKVVRSRSATSAEDPALVADVSRREAEIAGFLDYHGGADSSRIQGPYLYRSRGGSGQYIRVTGPDSRGRIDTARDVDTGRYSHIDDSYRDAARGVRELVHAHGVITPGTDGGEPPDSEKFLKIAGTVALVGAALVFAAWVGPRRLWRF